MKSGQLLGHFRLLSLLGSGGMGEVWAAEDLVLERKVALKVLPEAMRRDEEALARFRREARVLAACNHPHVAQVYELEEVPDPDNPEVQLRCIVMELVEGENLDKRKPLSFQQVLSLAKDLAATLHATHSHGIVHRDLKPANLVVDSEGRLKVLDFGLALFSPKSALPEHELTRERFSDGFVAGTPAYMAPEVLRGAPGDEKSDVWSFGCTVAELVSGQRLAPGNTIPEIVGHILAGNLAWRWPQEVPSRFRKLLERCCAPEPQARPSFAEIHRALERMEAGPRGLSPPWLVAAGLLLLAASFLASRLLFPPSPPPLLDPNQRLAVALEAAAPEQLPGLLERFSRACAEQPFLVLAPKAKAQVLVRLQPGRSSTVFRIEELAHGTVLAELATPPGTSDFGAVFDRLQREQIRRQLALEDDLFSYLASKAANATAAAAFRDGVRLFFRTRYGEAEALFHQALAADPTFWPAPLFLAVAAKATGRFPQAHENMAKARGMFRQHESADALVLEAFAALVAEDWQRQVEALRALLQPFPHSPYLLFRTALALRLQDRPEESIPLLRKLVREKPQLEFSPVWETLAQAQLLAGDYEGCLSTCREGRKRFPTRHRYDLYESFACRLLGRPAAAREALREALRKYADFGSAPPLTRAQFGQFWAAYVGWPEERARQYATMLEEAERRLASQGGDSEALAAKAEALRGLGQHAAAAACYEALFATGQQPSTYQLTDYARALAAQGLAPQARQALERAGALWRSAEEPAKGVAAYNLAIAWAEVGELEEALRWLERARDLHGFDRLDLLLDPDLDKLREKHLLERFFPQGPR